jgi:signal transduction histidine kinase
VLASFTVTVIAFAVTVGWSVVAQRTTAQHSEELARGYVPVALKLGQLRAAQATVSSLVDGINDERRPVSIHQVLLTLVSARRTKFLETRVAVEQGLATVGAPQALVLADRLSLELRSTEESLADDRAEFDRLFAAIATGDRGEAERLLTIVSAEQHDAERRLHQLADDVSHVMNDLSEDARKRERRSILALIALAILTLGVGIAVSIHTRRLLAPLHEVTERAKAVARGDLVPREVHRTDDEIGELAASFERMVGAVADAQEKAVSNERFAAIGKMAAHVTHEIRNPLSSIGLNLELLEEELAKTAGPEDARGLLKAVSREVGRLELLSEEYLRLARLPSPRMEAEDIAGLVRDVADFARAELERASATITVTVAENLPPVLFDESQIRQAILNLLRNAREAMPQGGPIEIRVAAEGMSVVIRIEDRGGGIPEEIRGQVFDPFFSTKGEGTGLGLAITRQIVLAHGGIVSCDPREGGGTSFRIALPIAPARATSTSLPRISPSRLVR